MHCKKVCLDFYWRKGRQSLTLIKIIRSQAVLPYNWNPYEWEDGALGAVSLSKYRLISISISIIRIRLIGDRLVFITEIPYMEKPLLYWNRALDPFAPELILLMIWIMHYRHILIFIENESLQLVPYSIKLQCNVNTYITGHETGTWFYFACSWVLGSHQ